MLAHSFGIVSKFYVSAHFSLVKWNHSFQADDNFVSLPVELVDTTGLCLLNLNDHCLLEIFSSSSLTLMDLCSVAETCTRFKALAQRSFTKKFCIERNNGDIYKFISKKSRSDITEDEIERILKSFGHNLYAYSSHGEDAIVMNAVPKYCDGGTLKELTFCGMDCTVDFIVKFKSIFRQLFVLTIRECKVHEDISTVQLNFDSLIELNVIRVEGCDAIFKKTFPKLKSFRFDDATCSIGRGDILSMFIGCHPFLSSLRMDRCCLLGNNDLAYTVGNSCNDLVNLTLRNTRKHKTLVNFSKLKDLKQLKVLYISIDPTEFDNLFALLSTLKSLEIVKVFREYSSSCLFSDVDQLIKRPILTELTNLRELHLIGCRRSYQLPWKMLRHLRKLYVFDSTCQTELPYIIDQLENLEELEIGDLRSVLSEEDFVEIVRICKGRPNVLTVKCRMFKSCKYLKNCDENGNVKLINLRS